MKAHDRFARVFAAVVMSGLVLAVLGLALGFGSVILDSYLNYDANDPIDPLLWFLAGPALLAAYWRLARAPALSRRQRQLGILLPLLLAPLGLLLYWPVAVYIAIGLTLQLAWTLPWGATTTALVAAGGGRASRLWWAWAVAAPLLLALGLFSVVGMKNAEAIHWQYIGLLLLVPAVIAVTARLSWLARRPYRERLATARLVADGKPVPVVPATPPPPPPPPLDPRAVVARDLLGWKRRFIPLLLVCVAGLWPLVVLIAAYRAHAGAQVDAIMADFPFAPSPETNGPAAFIAATGPITIWPHANLDIWSQNYPLEDPSEYRPGGRIHDYVASTEAFHAQIPAILALPDRRWPQETPLDDPAYSKLNFLYYVTSARLSSHAYHGDWDAYRRDFDLQIASTDLVDLSADSMAALRGLYALPRATWDQERLQAHYLWDMPPELHQHIRDTFARHEQQTVITADAVLAIIERDMRYMILLVASGRTDMLKDGGEPPVMPLPLRIATLNYPSMRADAEDYLAEAAAPTRAAYAENQYRPVEFERRLPRIPILFNPDSLESLDTFASMSGRGIMRSYFGRLASLRVWIARQDAIAYYREHQSWPASIAELGEPDLRIDPFAPDGATLRLRVDSQGRLRIWSIDRDQEDDNGWRYQDDEPEPEDKKTGRDIVTVIPPPGWKPAPLQGPQLPPTEATP